MSQHFYNTFYFQLWLVLVWYFIIYIYNIFITNYRWQIVTSFKLSSPLKIVHLKKQKNSPRRLLVEQWILAHPIGLNQKKIGIQQNDTIVITDFKIGHTIVITFLFINSSLAPRICYEMNVKILWTSHFFFFYKELRLSNCENIVTTTKFYNIFTINLFLVVVSTNFINFYFILSYEKLTL